MKKPEFKSIDGERIRIIESGTGFAMLSVGRLNLSPFEAAELRKCIDAFLEYDLQVEEKIRSNP